MLLLLTVYVYGTVLLVRTGPISHVVFQFHCLDIIMVFVFFLSSVSCELRCWMFSSFSFKDLEVQQH